MINERAIAYKEVYTILERMDEKYRNKIPSKLKKLLIENMDKNYSPKINAKIPLREQKLNPRTFTILAMLNLNYWCEDENKKKELISLYTANSKLKQERLREKYDHNKIFANRISSEKKTENFTAIAIKEETFIQKILNKVKSIFYRKNKRR